MPLHVSSTMCSSSGSQNCIIQHLVSSHLQVAVPFYKFIKCLYMFRALCANHQEIKIVLYSIWYHHTCRWPSRFISLFYTSSMFRALCAHHQEVKIVLYSIWYHHTCRCDDTRCCIIQF